MSNEQSLGRSVMSQTQDQVGSWAGGWYLFEDGNVIGPLDAKDTFSRPEKTASGQSRMVSRKGFAQWYPIQDFATIHAMAGRYSDHLGQAGNLQSNTQKQSIISKHVGPKDNEQQNAFKTIETVQKELNAKPALAGEGVKFGQVVSTTSSQTVKKLTAKEKKRLLDEERRSRKLSEIQLNQTRGADQTQNLRQPVSFEQQYLQVSSRLRLGLPASPFMRAFIYTPFSLGLYWWPWLARTGEEVSWHLNGASRMNFILPMWMCMIPGVHLVLAYFVARMVRQMEAQNGYRTVNPWLATVAAIFPPFYIAMIQSALNRHWRLHVYHSAVR